MLAITKCNRGKHAATLSLLCAVLLTAPASLGDVLADARLLLRVSNTAEHFETRTQSQIRNILRTYASIVAMESDVELPAGIRSTIAACYTREYAWENFRGGFAEIIAEHLSPQQIQLLIGFYRNRGLPPSQIDTFKATIAKAELIEAISADYIFSSSPGCVHRDAQLISSFIDSQSLPSLLGTSLE